MIENKCDVIVMSYPICNEEPCVSLPQFAVHVVIERLVHSIPGGGGEGGKGGRRKGGREGGREDTEVQGRRREKR